ncbi:hypothetical protein BN996_00198 [Haloferax massiliensis]|uniref:Uncharacterized protein n=1 Tax=Haloferax massiliensis TaxID=1476858 RepID=A0A0D6JMA6_9EURY|nr:hypothetical protein BN996_00198 [Haloferax massiliensis]
MFYDESVNNGSHVIYAGTAERPIYFDEGNNLARVDGGETRSSTVGIWIYSTLV